MKRKLVLFITMTIIIAVVIISCDNKDQKSETSVSAGKEAMPDSSTLVKRGEYLVSICGCDDCHTPKKTGANGPEPDIDRRLSGYKADAPLPPVDTNVIKKGWALATLDLNGWAGPWGASFTANITSDETGIGNWTEEQFEKAIRKGKWKGMDGNRTLLPPMPWQDYAHLTDEDVKSIYYYLKTTKPIKNIEPAIKSFADLK